MIVVKSYMKRADEVVLVKTYSDAGYYIQNEDYSLFEYAVDPVGHTHKYTESTEPIDSTVEQDVEALKKDKQDTVIQIQNITVDSFTKAPSVATGFKWIGRIECEQVTADDYVTLTFSPETRLDLVSSYCISYDGYVEFYTNKDEPVEIATMTITKKVYE